MGILDQIKSQVDKLSPDEVRAQLAKLQEQKAKQATAQKAHNATPEAKAKRSEYNALRNTDPAVISKRKEYHQRPEVRERMKAYRTERNERIKVLLARAEELGLTEKQPA